MAPQEPQDSPSLVALAALGRDAPKVPTAVELDRGLDRLRARVAAENPRGRALRLSGLLGAGAAVVACVVVIVHVLGGAKRSAMVPEPPLEVSRIEGGSVLDGGYLSQSGRTGLKVFFREGSTFEMAPDTRGRLRTITQDGARLAIERGTASLHITPNRTRRWFVEAGPFTVTVKGTVFSVSWDPSSERFELRLREGRVVVSGPTVGEALALRAGQRLVVSLPRGESAIIDEPAVQLPDPATANDPALAPVASPMGKDVADEPPSARTPSTRRSASPAAAAAPLVSGAGPRRWGVDLAKGRWDHILADVDRNGVDATLESAGIEDLFVLADAARYRRRTELARAALMAERRRFPYAPRSLDAIFLLGRVDELRDHGTAHAIAWYDEYLRQAPAGAYAAEALGRKMILTSETRGPAAARPIANAYLVRFPGGSYVGAARALQRVP